MQQFLLESTSAGKRALSRAETAVTDGQHSCGGSASVEMKNCHLGALVALSMQNAKSFKTMFVCLAQTQETVRQIRFEFILYHTTYQFSTSFQGTIGVGENPAGGDEHREWRSGDCVTGLKTEIQKRFEDNNPARCITYCSRDGYRYAGVNHYQCRCSNEEPTNGEEPGEPSRCSMNCPGGGDQEICGDGHIRWNVFSSDGKI